MGISGKTNGFLLRDIVIILISIGVAVVLVKTQVLANLLASTVELEIIGSFVAGIFFTSVLTTAPAIVTLGELIRLNSILPVALFGALGAVIGDLVIFWFVRDRFAEHMKEIVSHRHISKRLSVLFKRKLFRRLSFFVGGLLIASPLPDELGIGVLGFSKIKTMWFMPLSFVFHFLGIVFIGLVARAL